MRNLKLKLLGQYLLVTALTNSFSTGKFRMIDNDIHPPHPTPPHPKEEQNKGWYRATEHEPYTYFLEYAICLHVYICHWMNLHIHGTLCMLHIWTWRCLYVKYLSMTLSVCQIFEHDTDFMSSIWTWQCLYAQYLNMTLCLCQISYIGWFFYAWQWSVPSLIRLYFLSTNVNHFTKCLHGFINRFYIFDMFLKIPWRTHNT